MDLYTCTTSFEDCCNECGDDSVRCLRGPCSENFFIDTFFSISMPTQQLNFWDIVFTCYGMVPHTFLFIVGLTAALNRKRRTIMVVFLYFGGIAIPLLNEIIGELFGDCEDCPRPCGSCVASSGFPSGHSMTSIATVTWLTLEYMFGLGYHWSKFEKWLYTFGTCMLFGFVGYGRIYLGDHNTIQVVVGSANGFVAGIIYFAILRYGFAPRYKNKTHWKIVRGLVIINNYLPVESGRSQQMNTNDFQSIP